MVAILSDLMVWNSLLWNVSSPAVLLNRVCHIQWVLVNRRGKRNLCLPNCSDRYLLFFLSLIFCAVGERMVVLFGWRQQVVLGHRNNFIGWLKEGLPDYNPADIHVPLKNDPAQWAIRRSRILLILLPAVSLNSFPLTCSGEQDSQCATQQTGQAYVLWVMRLRRETAGEAVIFLSCCIRWFKDVWIVK